jgi:hypothetical protein
MYVKIDLSVVPPEIVLEEPDDFKRFELRIERVEHAHVDVAALKRLAGERASDPAWLERLDGMLAYGWGRAEGAVRAHVEWA